MLRPLILSIVLSTCIAAEAHAQSPSVAFKGIEIVPLGNATVSVDSSSGPGTDHLVVQNIGSSGQDGYSVMTGPVHGGGMTFREIPVGGPTGAAQGAASQPILSLIITAVPSVRATPNLAGALLIIPGPGGASLQPDFGSVFAPTWRAEVWNGGQPVAQFTGQSGTVTFTGQGVSGSGAPDCVEFNTHGVTYPLPDPPLPVTQPTKLHTVMSARYAITGQFDVGSPPQSVMGDEIRFFPENPVYTVDALERIDATFRVGTVDPPATVEVGDVALRQFGRLHRGVGAALVYADPGATTATGIDVPIAVDQVPLGGVYGVTVSPLGLGMGDTGVMTGGEECIIWDIKDSDVGTAATFRLDGTLTSAPGTTVPLASLQSICDGTRWTVTPDFSPLGATTVDVTLFDDTGAPVAAVSGFGGSVEVDGVEMPVELGARSDGAVTLSQRFSSNRLITLVGYDTYNATRLAVTTSTGFSTIGTIDGLSGTWSQAPSSGTLTVKVEKSQFKWASLSGVEVSATGSGYVDRGHDYILYMPNVDPSQLPILSGSLVMRAQPTSWYCCGHERLPTLPTNLSALGAMMTLEVQYNESDLAFLRAGLERTATGVDMTVDPALSGAPEVEVVARDETGAVKVKFPWLPSAQPLVELPDWPVGMGSRRLPAVNGVSIWLDLGYPVPLTFAGGPAAAPAGARAAAAGTPTTTQVIEVIYQGDGGTDLADLADFGVRTHDLGPSIFAADGWRVVGTGGAASPRARTVLYPPYPNPFNPRATLSFHLREAGAVSLRIYTVQGRYVTTVHEGPLAAGPHAFAWEGRDHRGRAAASGVYLVELRTPDGALHAKLNLVK